MMPLPIPQVARAADGAAAAAHRRAKGDPTAVKRDAVIAVIAIAVNIAVEEDVAVDPGILRGAFLTCGGWVAARNGFQPEFDGEIAADIHRAVWVVERDFNAVNIAAASAEKAQGGLLGLSRRSGENNLPILGRQDKRQ